MPLFRDRTGSLVLDGYYGMRNTGDDAFCFVALQIAKQRWPKRDVGLVAPPGALPFLPYPAQALLPRRPRFNGHVRGAALSRTVRSGFVLHVGGSTFMQPLTRHRDQARLARAGLLRLHGVGVSVGPFETAREADGVRRILAQFRSVSVRDTASLERVADLVPQLKVSTGFDIAVLLEVPPAGTNPSSCGSRSVIGVTVCADEANRSADSARERRRFERTLATVQAAASTSGASVRVLVFNDHPRWGDYRLSTEFAARLSCPVEVINRSSDPRRMLAAVAGCDVLLATRLHSAVFAYTARVPFAVVAYQRKGVEVAAEMGLPERFVFGPDGPDPRVGAARILELLDDPDQPTLRPLAEARMLAENSFPVDT